MSPRGIAASSRYCIGAWPQLPSQRGRWTSRSFEKRRGFLRLKIEPESAVVEPSRLRADVSVSADVGRLVATVEDELGTPVAILVNNAGVTRPQPIVEITKTTVTTRYRHQLPFPRPSSDTNRTAELRAPGCGDASAASVGVDWQSFGKHAAVQGAKSVKSASFTTTAVDGFTVPNGHRPC